MWRHYNKLLIRDDELQELILKSEDLSFSTKRFATEAEKMNSCCILF